MAAAVSPLAPKSVPAMPAIPGVKLGTAAAGIKYTNRTDVLLAVFVPGTTVAGVFTTSKCPSAPVEWCRDRLRGAKPRALVTRTRSPRPPTRSKVPRACSHRGRRSSVPGPVPTEQSGYPSRVVRFGLYASADCVSKNRVQSWSSA